VTSLLALRYAPHSTLLSDLPIPPSLPFPPSNLFLISLTYHRLHSNSRNSSSDRSGPKLCTAVSVFPSSNYPTEAPLSTSTPPSTSAFLWLWMARSSTDLIGSCASRTLLPCLSVPPSYFREKDSNCCAVPTPNSEFHSTSILRVISSSLATLPHLNLFYHSRYTRTLHNLCNKKILMLLAD
jgi:hypothetical protein